MKVYSIVFMIQFILSSSQLPNEPQLVFSTLNEDIHIIKLEKLKSTINYNDTDILANTTGDTALTTEIDYNLRANVLIWRKLGPENALFVTPINKNHSNLLGIRDKTRLLNLNKSNSSRVSVDWIHNLVYYDENEKIIVLNMTYPRYGFILISDTNNLILDLSVNPLDSLIFWSDFDNRNNKGRIMRASQDGSNQIVLVDSDIKKPTALTTDLVLRRVFWIDRFLFKLSSIDFDGKDMQTVLKSHKFFKLSYFMDIFGDSIYWSNYFHHSLPKTSNFSLNETQINYLFKAETAYEIKLIKIIDSSLQPNSINRCIDANCTHLCIPVSANQYRCVCPNVQYDVHYSRQKCSESIHTIPLIKIENSILETTQQLEKTSNPISIMSNLPTNILNKFSKSETTNSFQKSTMSSESQPRTSDTTNTDMRNSMMNTSNTSFYFRKACYITSYQTSTMLLVLLVISFIFNILFGFALILQLYRKRKSQQNIRLGSQRCSTEFKPTHSVSVYANLVSLGLEFNNDSSIN